MNLFDLFIRIGIKDEASDKLSTLSNKIGNGLSIAAKLGTTAIAAVGSGVSALGTYATKVGSDFEAQMSKVSSISGATGDELTALEDKAKELGIATKFSATEAGKAFEYMAMAGWKTDDMLAGISGIMDLSAASGEDLALTSDIVTDALTAFGLAASDSTHFADVLARASSDSNTNVAMMGETFKYVAPVAGAMKYSIEDTAVAIGLMANAGIKGSQAGTSLRQMMSRLVKPTGDAEMALFRLGINIKNADGSAKPFNQVMDDLREAFSELTPVEQAQNAALIAGQEAMSGMLAIVNATEEDFDKLSESINNADGTSKVMADTMQNNLVGQFTLLKSSAEGFGLALYSKVQEPLTLMVSWATKSLSKLTSTFEKEGVDGMVKAAGEIISEALTTMTDKLPEFVDLAVDIINSLLQGITDNLDTITTGATEITLKLLDGILGFAPSVIEMGGTLIEKLIQGISENLDKITTSTVDIFTQLTTKAIELLPDIVQLGLDLIVSLASGITEAIQKDDFIQTVVDVIIEIVSILTDPENLKTLFETSLTLIKELSLGILDALPELAESATEVVDSLCEFFMDEENAQTFIDTGIDIVVAIGEAIIKAAPKLFMANVELTKKLAEYILETDWMQVGIDVVRQIKQGFDNTWAEVFTGGAIGNLIDSTFGKTPKTVPVTVTTTTANTSSNNSPVINGNIYLDSGALVGGISNAMDMALGTNFILNSRGALN